MVCTSLGSLLRPLFYFLDHVSYPQSVVHGLQITRQQEGRYSIDIIRSKCESEEFENKVRLQFVIYHKSGCHLPLFYCSLSSFV